MTTSNYMRIVHRRDRNNRALAKVVSAIEYLQDEFAELPAVSAAVQLLEQAKFDIVQERRNLNVALWREVEQRSKGVRP